jgi:hypothetical protein
LDWPAKVAVRVADWSEGMDAAAVVVKEAVVAPAGTVRVAGTGRSVLLLESAAAEPPVGAALERVRVQKEEAPAFREVGLQEIEERRTGARREMEAVLDCPAKVAVRVADWSEWMEAAAVVVNEAEVAPAGTVSDVGTGRRVLLLESAAAEPLVGAALERVMVQDEEAPAFNEVGLQEIEERRTGARREIDAVLDWPAKVAVRVADWSEGIEAAAVVVNEAEVAPAGTVREAATGRRVLLLESEMAEPPAGADPLSFTVHVVPFNAARVDDAHVKVLNVGGEVAGPVTTAPAPDSSIVLPLADAAATPVIPIEVLNTPWPIVKLTTATAPSETALALGPDNKQVYTPAAAAQLSVLPELIAAGRAEADMASTFLDGYVSFHWRADGALPAGEDKLSAKDTVPFAAATPGERANEPVCPKRIKGTKKTAVSRRAARRIETKL